MLLELAARARKVAAVRLEAQKQTNNMQQFLQQQQQQLQAIQQQVMVSLCLSLLNDRF